MPMIRWSCSLEIAVVAAHLAVDTAAAVVVDSSADHILDCHIGHTVRWGKGFLTSKENDAHIK